VPELLIVPIEPAVDTIETTEQPPFELRKEGEGERLVRHGKILLLSISGSIERRRHDWRRGAEGRESVSNFLAARSVQVQLGHFQGGAMFGKRISEYLDFQKVALIVVAVVGLLRLALSLAGVPNAKVAYLSMNVVTWAAAIYYGVAVYTRGFGTYRHLLPLGLFQIVVQQAIAVLGILLAIAGYDNVYAAPEFSFNVANQWLHLLSHLTIGIVVPPFLLWAVESLVLWITKKVKRQPATA
jgi:hypothetical protein